jgi:hypothetical protein
MRLSTVDQHLLACTARPGLKGLSRVLTEFLYFGVKNARACILRRDVHRAARRPVGHGPL